MSHSFILFLSLHSLQINTKTQKLIFYLIKRNTIYYISFYSNTMSKKVLKTKSKGTKDLDINKIKEDPSAYARSVSVDELVSILQTMSDHYYSKAESLVDDDIYDAMYDVLAKRDPSNKYLSQTGTTEISQSDVTLPHYMPSLSKLKKGDEKALRQWFSKYKKKYMVMEKLDGISVLINKTEQGVDIFTKKQSNCISTVSSKKLKKKEKQ